MGNEAGTKGASEIYDENWGPLKTRNSDLDEPTGSLIYALIATAAYLYYIE